eukprot:TRINITY_DN10765_c0_g1_i1.p1 TRINITY_DN10765_c0_g1~~TRINITY_DN10765_c0_g1_i1.p1  ORF type:complete len:481 (-),score=101.69 TRINITY_DN10765_c0_g1_i1:42-1484(-)
MLARILTILVIGTLLTISVYSNETALDKYMQLPDDAYSYKHVSTISGAGYSTYVLELTSQTWLTPDDSSIYTWKHWLTICVPDEPKQVDTGMVFIDGGSNRPNPPTTTDAMTLILCTKTKTITADLSQIPNQPATFPSDWKHQKRTEDAVIAFTWSHFVNNTKEPYWLLRMPMTKAVVKAMDAIQDFTSSLNVPKIENFIVGGASKRGWTTWTTGIVDKRVIAIIPIVIPVLNMVENINTMYQVYGEWSFALDDYLDMNIMNYLNKPQFQEMADVIDPFSYLDRLTMPKYIICATGDEFFLPDSPRHFVNQLKGPTYLRMVPNAEHSLAPQDIDVAVAVGTWFSMILDKEPLPTYKYKLTYSNTTGKIEVWTGDVQPTAVTVWRARTLSHTKRDFRLLTCKSPDCIQPVIWWPENLKPVSDGYFVATQDAPKTGEWAGFVIELEYKQSDNPVDAKASLKFTTEVNIVPDVYPFPGCGQNC